MTTTALKGYAASISRITGVTDPELLAEIEDTMRNDIFHSTLDWQSAAQFAAGAKEAHQLVTYLRSPEGAAEMAALMASMSAGDPEMAALVDTIR